MDADERRRRKAERARSPEQRIKRTAYMRDWREKNRAKHNEQARESHQRNKHKHVDKRRDDHLRRTVGITLAEKEAMVERQSGCCLICREAFTSSRSTHVDHDHATGRVRGILCHVCNTKLAWFERHRSAILEYLT